MAPGAGSVLGNRPVIVPYMVPPATEFPAAGVTTPCECSGSFAIWVCDGKDTDCDGLDDFQEVIRANRLNPQFFSGCGKFLARGGRVLFVMGGNDPGVDTFQRFFVEHYLRREVSPAARKNIEIRVIPGANHIFSLTESQEELTSLILDWTAR